MFYKQEAQSYADDNSLLFMETSAKTSMNVNEIFMAIGKVNFFSTINIGKSYTGAIWFDSLNSWIFFLFLWGFFGVCFSYNDSTTTLDLFHQALLSHIKFERLLPIRL